MASDAGDVSTRARSPDLGRWIGHDLGMAVDPIRERNAARLRRERDAQGLSLREVAIEIHNVRKMRGDDDLASLESLRQRYAQIEKSGEAGRQWSEDIAAIYGMEPAELFDIPTETRLPHPLLLQLPVDGDVLAVITAQQQAHIQAEHTFGPQHARPLVERDLETVEALIKSAPAKLRAQVRQAAGTIAEVAGWIAQDLGDHGAAEALTNKAAAHLRSAEPDLTAMIWMRQSNIYTRHSPELAAELAEDAADLIDGHEAGRLRASIARQRALAALANGDRRGFHRHAAHALEMGEIEPVDGDRAVYAHAAYVASDIAAGYLRLDEPTKAAELLSAHHGQWTSEQHRDRAVADMRLLHAYIAVREYSMALTLADAAIPGYLSAPSQRARRHLAQAGKLVRDRRRRDKNPLLQQLAGRIKNATQGVI